MRHLADRGASKLSGGQQQRVALARAIAFSPTVVLFDEPLSNLDAKLRAEMRVELRELQRRLDITSVYVTHDQEEALAISDRVIVMNVGRDRADRHAGGDLQRPQQPLRRRFRGLGQSHQGPPRRAPDTFETEGGTILRVAAARAARRETEVAVRTAYIDLVPHPGDNQLPGTVRQRMFHGDFVQYIVECAVGRLIVRRPAGQPARRGRAGDGLLLARAHGAAAGLSPPSDDEDLFPPWRSRGGGAVSTEQSRMRSAMST